MYFLSFKRRVSSLAKLLQHIPGVVPASFISNKSGQDESFSQKDQKQSCPFILVAHSSNGRWDVFSGNFENPLATFDQRQDSCDFASKLASRTDDSIVLIRDSQVN